ncbi:MAG: hypothetical protein JSW28_09230 [Thermoplasmata archaeon]|nr:MAG: hypothetical protein JSW28_09230 [Thermoplasmata archaeon]
MSILAPAKIRMWIEMWKEEVMASTPNDDLHQKFEEKQVAKGRIPPKDARKLNTELEVGGQKL